MVKIAQLILPALVFALVFGTVALVSIPALHAADTTHIVNSVQSSSNTGGYSSDGQHGVDGSDGQDGSSGQSGRDGSGGANGSDGAVISGDASAHAEVISASDGEIIERFTEVSTGSGTAEATVRDTYSATSAHEESPQTESADAERQLSLLALIREVFLNYVTILF